ncbi:hypothetical protein BH10BAC3_BH10BAC3_15300 [soil metagenome]
MKFLRFAAIFLVISTVIACSKKDSGSSNHTVNIRLTDNPYNAEEVNVDVRSVQLRKEDVPGEEDGWYSIETDDRIYNLLDLQNDVNVLLATGPYPYDRIHEIRLVLGDNNSIKIAGILYPLTVPSGSSSGLKIKIDKPLSQPATDIIIDFDAALSVHETGNGKYILRPVLRLK